MRQKLSNEETVNVFRRFATYLTGGSHEEGQPEVGALLESSPDGMVIANAEGRIVVVNSQTEILFGYGRQELAGQPVEMLIPTRFGELHKKHRASFVGEAKIRAMGAGLGLVGKRKNGTEFPVDISLSPLRTPQGLFIIAAVRDITERRQAEEQIKKLNAELGDALRRAGTLGGSGELAARTARDVEQHLDTLHRLLAQMERPANEDSRKELIEKMKDEVAHIAEITGSVISLHLQQESWKKR